MAEESFIPKKPTVKASYEAVGFGILFRLSFILFIAASLLTAALYFYRNISFNNLSEQKSTLQKLETEFEPSLISQLDKASAAISRSKDLLKNHIKSSEVFLMLEQNTLPEINFTSFSYASDKKSLSLAGEAASYADISSQSSVFESLPNIANVKFSNLGLRDNGRVTFDLIITFK